LELSIVCIVDTTGKVVKETKVETRPEALVKFFKGFGLPVTRTGLEAGLTPNGLINAASPGRPPKGSNVQTSTQSTTSLLQRTNYDGRYLLNWGVCRFDARLDITGPIREAEVYFANMGIETDPESVRYTHSLPPRENSPPHGVTDILWHVVTRDECGATSRSKDLQDALPSAYCLNLRPIIRPLTNDLKLCLWPELGKLRYKPSYEGRIDVQGLFLGHPMARWDRHFREFVAVCPHGFSKSRIDRLANVIVGSVHEENWHRKSPGRP
jgi:hypothetical protein